jgi:hypothetical protein
LNFKPSIPIDDCEVFALHSLNNNKKIQRPIQWSAGGKIKAQTSWATIYGAALFAEVKTLLI